MKIAVSETNGVIATHFAHVTELVIYEVFEEGMVQVNTIQHTFEAYESVFDRLLEANVEAVITGAIGHGSIEHIMGRGMVIYYGFGHTATEEACRAVFKGRVPKGHLMDPDEEVCQ